MSHLRYRGSTNANRSYKISNRRPVQLPGSSSAASPQQVTQFYTNLQNYFREIGVDDHEYYPTMHREFWQGVLDEFQTQITASAAGVLFVDPWVNPNLVRPNWMKLEDYNNMQTVFGATAVGPVTSFVQAAIAVGAGGLVAPFAYTVELKPYGRHPSLIQVNAQDLGNFSTLEPPPCAPPDQQEFDDILMQYMIALGHSGATGTGEYKQDLGVVYFDTPQYHSVPLSVTEVNNLLPQSVTPFNILASHTNMVVRFAKANGIQFTWGINHGVSSAIGFAGIPTWTFITDKTLISEDDKEVLSCATFDAIRRKNKASFHDPLAINAPTDDAVEHAAEQLANLHLHRTENPALPVDPHSRLSSRAGDRSSSRTGSRKGKRRVRYDDEDEE